MLHRIVYIYNTLCVLIDRQEISKGVRSSARAITAAEAGIRQVGGLASNGWSSYTAT